MLEQTFKTAAEVEELFKTHPDKKLPIFRIKQEKGLYIMNTELIPLFGQRCGDIEVYGLFTPRQMACDLPCNKYMMTPHTASFDFYILNNSNCVGFSPDRLVFTGKYYRKEREKKND